MQTLAWGTVVTLVLLLPGFCFFPGLYAPERFSRDLTPRNPLGSLAAIVLVALLTHAALSLAFSAAGLPVLWDRVLDTMLLSPAPARLPDGTVPPTTPRVLAAYYQEDAVRIPGYILLSCISAWLLGLLIGNLAVRGYFPFLSQHPWAAAIPRGQATFAFILSDVESSDRVLLYKGRLLHFGLNADGGFSYVMLTGTEQGYLNLDDGKPKAGEFDVIGRRALPEPTHPPSSNGLTARVLGFAGLGRLKIDVESGAVLSIAASNIRDVVIQTFPTPTGNTEVRGDLARFQQILKTAGHFEGEVDGRPGPRMDAAVKRFQEEWKIVDETGLGVETRFILETIDEDSNPTNG